MVVANNQRWLTCARDDEDAWKCILLARSLRQALTTRLTGVFISDEVSEMLRDKLQDEFDVCSLIGEKRMKQYPNFPFATVAKLSAWGLRGIKKFVFLDCNSLVIKNADELFRGNGIRMMTGSDKIGLIVGNPDLDKGSSYRELEMILQYEEGISSDQNFSSVFPLLGVEYGLEMSWGTGKSWSTPITGDECKIVYFCDGHPMNSPTFGDDEWEDLGLGAVEKVILNLCEKLLPEKLGKIGSVGTLGTFEPTQYENLCDSIAIIGMSSRFPGANSIDEFWKLLEAGDEGICRVPDGRWTKDNAIIRLTDVRKTQAGFLSCPIDQFDAKFFNINSADMAFMDPQQRMTLQIVWEALEHSGINPENLKNSLTGVFGGFWRDDYKEMLQQIGVINESDFFRVYMGNALGTLTARISHYFDLAGPAISTESGCSTSIVGVDLACENLRNENCKLAIAMGCNLLIHSFSVNMLNLVVSQNGRCKTFDADADGFGRAEGVAALVLKRFPDAVADGDRIWGLIRGSAVVQEGPSKSMGTPTVDCEALAMELALERAGVHPKDVSFVETHGTGTPIGDPLELAAVAKIYLKERTDVLTVGSLKTNLGHTESVCGIAGIIKTVLSMKHELIPKHLNFKSLNPDINLTGMQLPLEAIEWKKNESGKPRIAGVSSFGITGTDAHVIIQETPQAPENLNFTTAEPRQLRIFTFSGKSEESLRLQLKAYRNFLQSHLDRNSLRLEDVEFTQHIGRSHFAYRKTITASTIEELIKEIDAELEAPLTKSKPFTTTGATTPKICFLFTGQGSQYPGMSKSLYDSSLVFSTHFDKLDSMLSASYNFRLKDILWGDKSGLLKRTLYSQTSIFCVEYCLLKLWESWGIKPDTVLGHSLGEFGAAVAAGILSLEDALHLVVSRAGLVDVLPNAGMIVVGASLATVENLLKQISVRDNIWLDIAAVNTDQQTVLAGPNDFVQKFALYCENNNLKSHILDANHAFHSRLMDPVLETYNAIASTIVYNQPNKCKFISGMEGKVMKQVDANYWTKQTKERVRFMEASETALKDENTIFIEIGPHPVLTAMMMINSDNVDIDDPIVCQPSLRRKHDDWATILSSLGKLYTMGFQIKWQNFHRFSQGMKIDLPGHVFEEKQYWLSIQEDGTIPFHPLVGAHLPNASGVKIFKNDLSVHRVPFLQDHVLGNKLIFPGAAMLEMCLVAGFASTFPSEGNYPGGTTTSGICVKNFSIESPVCLNDKKSTEFQVVVTKSNDSGDPVSTVYTKLYLDSSNFKWIRHASATFDSSPAAAPTTDVLSLDFIKSRCTEQISSGYDYKAIEDLGYNFGPAFKILKTAWTVKEEASLSSSSQDFLFEFNATDDPDQFKVHPCVIDAMFQAQILGMGMRINKPYSKTMMVPLQVENFTCWGSPKTKSGYIYVTQAEAEGEKDVYLYDSTGQLIAKMKGTEFVETTLNNINALIDSQKNPYPRMYEQAYRDFLGPCERRVRHDDFTALKFTEAESVKHNSFTPEEEDFYNSSNELFALYMVKALVKLGFNERIAVGQDFQWPDISEELNVAATQNKFLRYILMELAEDKWLQITHTSLERISFKVIKAFTNSETLSSRIEYLKNQIRSRPVGVQDVNCVEPLGENLSDILSGNLSALSILFPEGTNVRGPAEIYYTDSLFARKSELLTQYSIPQFVNNFTRLPSEKASLSKPIVRILEVGAGTGAATKLILPLLVNDNNNSKFEYTYTDISNAFLHKGEELFENTGILTKFDVLNIEEDPLTQGYIPGHYDAVMASYVVHATRDIKETLNNIKKLLKPSGNLIMLELTNPNRPVKLLFGGLEQFWSFNDVNLRPYNCELSVSKWKQVFQECGFIDFASLNSYNWKNALISGRLDPNANVFQTNVMDSFNLTHNNLPTWVVFGNNDAACNEIVLKLQQCGRRVVLVTPSQFTASKLEEEIFKILSDSFTKDSARPEGIAYLWGLSNSFTYQEIIEPYLYIGKYLSHAAVNVKIIAFTRGNLSTGPSDFVFNRPDASPLIGLTNAMINEIPGLIGKCIDMDQVSSGDPDIVLEAFTEIFTMDQETIVVYRKNRRHVPRLQPYRMRNNSVEIPSCSRYRMILPTSNMISDLRFAPFKLPPLGDDEIEIEVKAYAMNFRDLMVVIKPDPVFESFTTVGIDYSGVVVGVGSNIDCWKIGDRVLGARCDGNAMPSHVITKGKHVYQMPGGMTFADGATLPVAYTTVSLCFLEIAKIKEGDVILIHTASGGVGLAAIVVAQWKKCKIVATAGSHRKRQYLRNLGVEHVFNSRTTEYEHEIRKALGGRGVTVVLNSLTGPGFKEATLAICEQGARFIEMSKMNIWSKDQVSELRPDVMYKIADLATMTPSELNDTFMPVKTMLDEQELGGHTKPLPHTRFDLTDIRDAFEFMQEAKHLGKIVIAMPEPGKNNLSGRECNATLFNDNATYLITGGFGGIGLEVAKWMSRNGAMHILLCGRSPPTKEAEEQINEIRSRGVHVMAQQCDVGNFEACRLLIEEINKERYDPVSNTTFRQSPPLRGIMHAAGALADGTLDVQTWERFEAVFNAKVRGSWNLHQLTLGLPHPLEHFVMFSSLAALFGSIAQSNHCSGNYYLDSLAHYRNSIGLPGATINWGQWGQVGVAANLNIPGLMPFTVVQGLAALENTLKTNKTQIAVCEGDVGLGRKAFPSAKQLLSELEECKADLSKELDGEVFWKEYDVTETREQKYDVVRKYIKTILRLNLKLDKNEEIDDHVSFAEIGMDSLMMVEMKNGLQMSVGKRVKISIASVKDCKTVAQLSLRLVDLISGKVEIPPPTREELRDLIIEDSILPSHISADAASIKNFKKLSEISTVLVSGATGTLGPYVVYEILKQPSVQKVYCLMRENKIFSPLERFRRIFKDKKLLQFVDLNKIDFVIGDVSEPNLGMSQFDYERLAAEVEAVFHLAVKSSLDEFYAKSDDPKHSRNINVSGMKNILTFSVEERLKYVYNASTMIAETNVDETGRFWEDWPIEGEFDNQANSSYPISKYVCDLLLTQAVERGVPCKSFRIPNIGGDSIHHGNFQILDSHLMIRMLAYMYMGMMPAQNLPMSIIPVDLCAKFTIELFFNEETGFEMFNVANPSIFDEREFDEVALEFGVHIQVLEPDEFIERAKKLDINDDVIQIVRIALARENEKEYMEDNLPNVYVKWIQGDKDVFLSKKLCKYLPNEYPTRMDSSLEILKRDLQYARDTGIFDKFGIKYSDST